MANSDNYEPYIFRSGKYQGQSVEEIIFKDPAHIAKLLYHKEQGTMTDSALSRHLDFISKTPDTKLKCPICKNKSVKYFLFLNSEDISKDLICCEDPSCQSHLLINHPNDYLLPMKLSSLMSFRKKTLKKKMVSLLKKSLCLSSSPTATQIFAAFVGDPYKYGVQLIITF